MTGLAGAGGVRTGDGGAAGAGAGSVSAVCWTVGGRVTGALTTVEDRGGAVEATTVGDQDRFLAAGTRFHDLIVKAVDNDLYAAFYSSIARLSEPARRAEAASPTVRRRVHREHVVILKALRDHDTAAAIAAMRSHLDALTPRSRLGGWAGSRPPRG